MERDLITNKYMKNSIHKLAFLFCTFLLSATFSSAQAQELDIKEALGQIEGLAFEEISSGNPRYRIFEIQFQQPEDHNTAGSPTFPQRLVLWHLNEARPMVLQTSGYAIFSRSLSALAMEFDANQIQVEHRFFQGSTPASKNWALDNIAQSAADFHRITVAMKSIYKAKWVNTGRSKGGMTSVYHRKFYPNDLDATVAHVAPHSFSLEDERYADFVANNIGGEQNIVCRENLLESQKILLQNKASIMQRFEGNFGLLGSKEIATEHAVIEMPWAYWQYAGPGTDCSNVPAPTASVDEHISFLTTNNDPAGYNDESLATFVPYYYQAATQLGNPGTDISNLLELLSFEDTFNINSYVPREIPAVYDNAVAMREVSDWLKNESQTILFVYGEYDPWTAGAYEDVRVEGDNHRLDVAKKNHGAQFIDLKGEAQALAYQKLRSWLNIEAEAPQQPDFVREANKDPIGLIRQKSLENVEFNKIRGRRL